MLMRALRSIVLGCSISGGLLAQTIWVVDATNGPGTNFTDIPPAIAAVADGDVLLVRAGNYSPFTLTSKGLTILGENSVVNGGYATIQSTNAAQTVVVSRMQFSNYGLKLVNCAGPALLDSLTAALLEITGCTDVRGRFLATNYTCTVAGSRFESTLGVHRGKYGQSSASAGYDGKPGLAVNGSSWVQLASSNCLGGAGGHISTLPYSCTDHLPGDGGPGLSASGTLLPGGAFVLDSRGGRGGLVTGASAGHESTHLYCGGGGSGALLNNAATLRISSGVVLRGGAACEWGGDWCRGAGTPAVVSANSSLINTSDRDPVLELANRPFSGSPIRLKLFAPAGSTATLLVGTSMTITPTAGVIVPQLTTPLQTVPLGVVPANESIAYDLSVPPQSTGALVVVQSEVTLPNGTLLRSNSVPVVYR